MTSLKCHSEVGAVSDVFVFESFEECGQYQDVCDTVNQSFAPSCDNHSSITFYIYDFL